MLALFEKSTLYVEQHNFEQAFALILQHNN
jgi:hypothetical protein